jgi:hypothetical protein
MEDVIVQSQVDPALVTRTLARGSVAAGLGIVIILIAGMELPASQLAIWGIPILLLGLALIALGLIPYRIIARRRDNPDILTVTDEGVHYTQMGKPTLTIPFDALARVSYLSNPPAYGVLVKLKEHPTEKVHVHTRDYDVLRVRHKTRRRFGADLFFPFFQQTEFDELRRGLALANFVDEY